MNSVIDRTNDKVSVATRRGGIIFRLITITVNDTYVDYQPIDNSILIEKSIF